MAIPVVAKLKKRITNKAKKAVVKVAPASGRGASVPAPSARGAQASAEPISVKSAPAAARAAMAADKRAAAARDANTKKLIKAMRAGDAQMKRQKRGATAPQRAIATPMVNTIIKMAPKRAGESQMAYQGRVQGYAVSTAEKFVSKTSTGVPADVAVRESLTEVMGTEVPVESVEVAASMIDTEAAAAEAAAIEQDSGEEQEEGTSWWLIGTLVVAGIGVSYIYYRRKS